MKLWTSREDKVVARLVAGEKAFQAGVAHEREEADKKANAKAQHAVHEELRMAKVNKLKAITPMGSSFQYLEYRMKVVGVRSTNNTMSRGAITPGRVFTLCEYRHKDGDILQKEFPFDYMVKLSEVTGGLE